MGTHKPFLIGIIAVGLLSAAFHGLGLFSNIPWHIVYSDVLGFFQRAAESGFPYLDKPMEYPVLTGLFIHLMAVLGQNRAGYYILSALFLILFAAVATYFLYRITPEENRKKLWLYWIFAPSMLIFLTFNWDILTLLFVILAFYFIKKDKDYLAAFFLALGFAGKLYPVLYLIPLLLRKPNFKTVSKLIGVFLITVFAVNAFFLFSNFDGWSYFYTLNSLRNSNPDSIWTIARFFFRGLDVPAINLISLLLFGSSYTFLIWKLRRQNTLVLCFVATLLFLIFNKVFSPQYILWLLPFFVLLPAIKKKWFYTLEFSNLAAFFLILPWHLISKEVIYFYYSAPFVVIRHIALIAILIAVLNPRTKRVEDASHHENATRSGAGVKLNLPKNKTPLNCCNNSGGCLFRSQPSLSPEQASEEADPANSSRSQNVSEFPRPDSPLPSKHPRCNRTNE